MHTLGHSKATLASGASGTEKRQAAVLDARPTGAEECRGRKRRPLQHQEQDSASLADVGPLDRINCATTPAESPSTPTAPDAVRERLVEVFKRPEWHAVPSEAKDLISEMLTVDASSRPSAAKIMQSTWLMSP